MNDEFDTFSTHGRNTRKNVHGKNKLFLNCIIKLHDTYFSKKKKKTRSRAGFAGMVHFNERKKKLPMETSRR